MAERAPDYPQEGLASPSFCPRLSEERIKERNGVFLETDVDDALSEALSNGSDEVSTFHTSTRSPGLILAGSLIVSNATFWRSSELGGLVTRD